MRLDGQESDLPSTAEHRYHQATVHEEEGNFEQALADCDAAIAVTHLFLADVHNYRAILLEEMDRQVEAIEAYHLALGFDPEFDDAADNLDSVEYELETEYTQAGLEHEVEEPICPVCASSDVRYERYATRAVFVSLLIGFPLPFIFIRRRWRCASCGHRWRIGNSSRSEQRR